MSGNGTDLGSLVGMVRGLVDAQGAMRAEMGAVRAEMGAVRAEMGTMRADMGAMRAEMRAGFARLDGEVAGLRQAVTEYHSAVLGHGILISELESRVRRLEQHLNLPPAA